jgi:cellulose synthase/poly-beta-1,6-N-acetylglucosamine synthase-like glycosyltransferase
MNLAEPWDHIAERRQRLEEDLFLASLDLDGAVVERLRKVAKQAGATLEAELICRGMITEEAFYRGMAVHLGLPFLPALPVEQMVDKAELDLMLRMPHSLRLQDQHTPASTVLVPPLSRMFHLKSWFDDSPALRKRIAVTTPTAMRAAVWACGERRRLRHSVHRLSEERPQLSARLTLTGKQGFLGGIGLTLLAVWTILSPAVFSAFLQIGLSVLYLSTVMLRGIAHFRRWPFPGPAPEEAAGGPYPVYTVLVALYREAEVVPQLVEALRALDWPPSRLDIKFVCEATDAETLQALGNIALPPQMEIVVVPDMEPRTKPKALNYALAGARGAFLTIYDAEDLPHPGQLKAAHAAFRKGGPELACLQAPLTITNASENWLSSLFAAEYAIHFNHLLPMLARHRMPLPLGGTSNHFRREALERVGAWDPHNVTEDADLGLRLHRMGYRVGVIGLPTFEEAPTARSVWLGQRTRWFKGWMQTLLVSLRSPRSLISDLSFTGFLAYMLTVCGMLVSALCHPLVFLTFAWHIARLMTPEADLLSGSERFFLAIDILNLLAAYGYFVMAGLSTPGKPSRILRLRWAAMIPVYWLLLSLASWRALFELYRNPHSWTKTPHRPMKPPDDDLFPT